MKQPLPKGRKYPLKLPPARFWTLFGALAIALFFTLIIALLLLLGRRRPAPSPLPAVLEIIPAITSTSDSMHDAEGSLTGSATVPPIQQGIDFAIGAYVQVTGTGGDGLRLRDRPGLDGNVLLVASEAEVFKLADGPVDMDGYVWWSLVGPFDETRRGWAAENYLVHIQNP